VLILMRACMCVHTSWLQELYFRRNPGGPTDWQWSFDTEAWYNTDDLAQVRTQRVGGGGPDPLARPLAVSDAPAAVSRLHVCLRHSRPGSGAVRALLDQATQVVQLTLEFMHLQEETLLLDPPSLIFIMRLHLVGVARRKNAAAGALLAPPAPGARASRSQQAGSRQHRPHIPPPVQLPAWAQQELAQQQHGSVAAGSSLQAAGHAGGRQLLDAPDALCCPITGQVCCAMLCCAVLWCAQQLHAIESRHCH
jgi:hypothetical protein